MTVTTNADPDAATRRGTLAATPFGQSRCLRAVCYRCHAGPEDRPFAEIHTGYSISYVGRGSFGYAARGRRHDLVAGSLLLGTPGCEYVCSHEHHGRGDICLALHMSPEFIDDAGATPALWSAGTLPPHAATAMAGELLRAASVASCGQGIDEIACVLLSRAAGLVADRPSTRIRPGRADRRRSALAAEWLEAHAHEAVDLETAARECGLSPYHFLRMFSACTGITPHQYLVSVRLRNAARRLIADDESATAIAYECGFGDLSNFIRAFRRAAGVPPAEFRRRSRQGERRREPQFSPSAGPR